MAFASDGVDPEHVQAMVAAAETLRLLGAELVSLVVPDSSQVIWDWFDVCATQNVLVHEKAFAETPEAYGPSLSELIARGMALKATDYQKAITRRDAFRGDFEALFADVDPC